MSNDERINKIRKLIDEVDEELLALVNKRAEYAISISELNQSMPIGVNNDLATYRPELETQLLRSLMSKNNIESLYNNYNVTCINSQSGCSIFVFRYNHNGHGPPGRYAYL